MFEVKGVDATTGATQVVNNKPWHHILHVGENNPVCLFVFVPAVPVSIEAASPEPAGRTNLDLGPEPRIGEFTERSPQGTRNATWRP